MDGYFFGTGIASIIFLVLGLLNPLLVNCKQRKYVVLIFPSLFLLSFIIFYVSSYSGVMFDSYFLLGVYSIPVILEIISRKQDKVFNTKYSINNYSINHSEQSVQFESAINDSSSNIDQQVSEMDEPDYPRMIGGLIFIVFGCVILSMVNIYKGGLKYPVVLFIYLLIEMLRYKKSSIKYLKIYFIFINISGLANLIFRDYYGNENILIPIINLSIIVLMLIYVFKSKRVIETFIL